MTRRAGAVLISPPDATVRRAELREAASRVMRVLRAGTLAPPTARPADDVLTELMNLVTGDQLGDDYLPKLVDDLGLAPCPRRGPPSGPSGCTWS